jgi:hypothetical protein
MDRLGRIVLGVGSPLILVALLVGGGTGSWIFVLVAALFPPALMAIAAPATPRRGAVAGVVTLAAVLEAGSVGVLLLDGAAAGLPWPAGLPPATFCMLALLGGVPLILVPWSFAAGWWDDRPGRGAERR